MKEIINRKKILKNYNNISPSVGRKILIIGFTILVTWNIITFIEFKYLFIETLTASFLIGWVLFVTDIEASNPRTNTTED